MFKLGDNCLIQNVITPQSGNTLMAMTTTPESQAVRVFMPVRNEIIPDGQTAYFFGNKIIVTVHWSGFTEEDDEACKGRIRIAAGLNYNKCGVFMFVKFGNYRWGDVLIEPGLLPSFNNQSKGFDEIAFIFVDSDDGNMRYTRVFPIEEKFSRFFVYGNMMAMEYFHNAPRLKHSYSSTEELFEEWSAISLDAKRWLTQEDPEEFSKVTGVVNAEVDSNDNIHWSLNEED